MTRPLATLAHACALWCVLSSSVPAAGAQERTGTAAAQPAAAASELDAFMEKVLARREVNRKTVEQYVLDETEGFEIMGPGRWPVYRSRREYTWYVRDGMHVRSPVRVNGVPVGDDARESYEQRWVRRERERQERRARKEQEESQVTLGADGMQVVSGTIVPTEPRFVSEAYFMDFKFEPGNYYLAGREQLEGHQVLRIEYYPSRMFNDDKERGDGDKGRKEEGGARGKDDAAGQEVERRMNKTSLVTLWVDPSSHQIVKYTFDNVWLDFLPGAWLVKVDEMRASMSMGQPFPGVWLPRQIDVNAGVTLANGSFEASYDRDFAQYRLAEVATRMRVPGRQQDRPAPRQRGPYVPDPDVVPPLASVAFPQSPVLPPAASDNARQAAGEVVRDIRIHGNAYLTDREVLDLAGLAVGQPLGPTDVDAVTRRLKASGRFESVDVRKRYRSLTDSTDVALVLVVHENPGVRSAVGGVQIPGVPESVARPVGRLRSKLMFLPIVSFADGYGFTYGGRVSTVDLLGAGERLSVPLTWGGTRRAALEFERPFKSGPLTRVASSVAIWNRKNPRFEIRDQRVEVRGRAERVFADVLRAGVDASRSTISFGALDDTLWTVEPSVAIDTRLDPAFPANAIFATAGWTGMHFRSIPGRVNRYAADGRGYLRVFRQIVAAGRVAYTGADAGLPPYERLLLGGSSSVRGFRTGAFDGDRTLITAAEVRVPLTSVMSGARLGVTAFLDASKAWDYRSSIDDSPWHRGAGGGIFLIASIVRINLDVARGLKTGDTRVHLSSGFTF